MGLNIANPQSRLHLSDPLAVGVYTQWTNASTLFGAGNGLKVGVSFAGIAEVRQQSAGPLEFFQGNIERVRIFQSTQGPRVAIGHSNGPITFAGALLHLGDNFNGFGTAGHRTWMDVGTFCFQVSDNLYMGMKDETATAGADHYDAVLNWGDNRGGTGGGPDNFRFIFTEPSTSGGLGSGQDGLEVARFVPPSNNLFGGFMGIGNFYLVPQPKRKLDVFDDGAFTPGGRPQLRLTQTLNNNPNLGVFTDFQTTTLGDLYINARSGGLPRNVGIHTSTPGNTEEINSNAPNPGGNGSSGHRFTDMQYGVSIPQAPQPNQGVLSVNATGDVVYITNPTSVFGQTCGAIGNPGQLTQTTELPTNGFNFVFTNNQLQPSNVNNVGIGLSNGNCNPLARLDVLQTSITTSTIGINLVNTDLGTLVNPSIGIKSVMPINAPFNGQIAGWFQATQSLTMGAVALFVPQQGGTVSIGYPTPYGNTGGLLEVNGNIFMNGVLVSTSDQSYKINVSNIDNAMEKIKRLNGVYYNWDTIGYPNMNWESQRQVGFIAQNVDSVLPEVVRTDPNNKKLLVYDRIVALLVQGMKEQQAQIDSLLMSSGSRISQSNNQNTELSSDVILYQNYPNPFGDETVINYFLPDNVNSAKMIFYDETGRLVKEEIIENRGNGSVTLKTNNLASGIYSYSLEVNGKSVQTRKMQKIK